MQVAVRSIVVASAIVFGSTACFAGGVGGGTELPSSAEPNSAKSGGGSMQKEGGAMQKGGAMKGGSMQKGSMQKGGSMKKSGGKM